MEFISLKEDSSSYSDWKLECSLSALSTWCTVTSPIRLVFLYKDTKLFVFWLVSLFYWALSCLWLDDDWELLSPSSGELLSSSKGEGVRGSICYFLKVNFFVQLGMMVTEFSDYFLSLIFSKGLDSDTSSLIEGEYGFYIESAGSFFDSLTLLFFSSYSSNSSYLSLFSSLSDYGFSLKIGLEWSSFVIRINCFLPSTFYSDEAFYSSRCLQKK